MPETNAYEQNPTMFAANPLGFVLAVILIAAFGLGLLILAWWWIQTKVTKLTITDEEVLYEAGILSKEHIDVNINMIKTVKINQGPLQRLFGAGDVEIYTTGDMPEFTLEGMPDPDKIRSLIKSTQNKR